MSEQAFTVAAASLYDADGRPLRDAENAFTAEQAHAIVNRAGPMLLSASAGSGKTAVLAERFVRAVLEDEIKPHELLAITFTDKAAGELRSRIRARFSELGAREAARDTAEAWVSTFHGFCARVLRAHAVQAGLDPRFTVLDESAARNTRDEAFSVALAAFMGDGTRADALDLVAAWGVDRLSKAICDVHSQLRSKGQTKPVLPSAAPRVDPADAVAAFAAAHGGLTAEAAAWGSGKTLDGVRDTLATAAELLAAERPDLAAIAALKKPPRTANATKTPAAEAFADAIDLVAHAYADAEAIGDLALLSELLDLHSSAYAVAKHARSAVDYDDLELMVRDLFERSPAVATGYAERFARIMVDEFQDTNPLQLDLLRRLDRDNVFLVGDELQSIYSFRHADIEVFRSERRRHAALGLAPELATNWRSRPTVLAAINAAFGATVHGPDYVALNAGLGEEPLATGTTRTELLLTDAAYEETAPDDPQRAELMSGMPVGPKLALLAEARAVARRIGGLLTAGHKASDIVVLLRSAVNMSVFERALEREGIATLASGGRGYWLRQQVQDLTSYLRALANPLDEPALLSVLASPLVGLSSDGLAILVKGARDGHRPVWGAQAGLAGLGQADAARLVQFGEWFAAERDMAARVSISELIARVVQRTGYDLHVLRLRGGRRRLANVHKLQRLATVYEHQGGRDLRAFADHATAEVEAEVREPEAPVELGDLEAVRLMTIHAAKGLEFGTVVVAELGRQGNSSSPDLMVDGGEVGVRVIRPGRKALPALAFEDIRARRQKAEEAEERRVMHVAFTRAQERLILSGVVALGKDWPAARHAGPPLHWIGARVEPSLPHTLGAETPMVVIERDEGEHRLQCIASLTFPNEVVPEKLAEQVPEPQLTLALDTAGPLPVAPRPERVPPAIATVSFSSLSDYVQCSYRYYLSRILGLGEQEPPAELEGPEAIEYEGLDPRVRGTIAHRLLEDLTPASVTTADVLQIAEEVGAEPTGEEVEDLLALAQAFGQSPLAARLAAATQVHREHPFAFTLDPGDPGGPLVNGFVDVVAREADGGWLVVDYKTNRIGDADLEAIVQDEYGLQRSIYALAALLAGAPRADIAYCFLERPAEPVVSSHGPEDIAALLAEVQDRAAGLRAGDFPVAANPHRDLCLTCPGRGGLCSWPQERVLQPLAEA